MKNNPKDEGKGKVVIDEDWWEGLDQIFYDFHADKELRKKVKWYVGEAIR